jgi:hypothetical protein
MKPPLYLLALPRADEDRRRSEVARRVRDARVPTAGPVRWVRTFAAAVPTSLRVFVRQMTTPLGSTIDAGTPVFSSTGRRLGVVRSLVVEVGSGGASYAVTSETAGSARVVLLPKHALRGMADVAVIDERDASRLPA